MTTRRVFSIRPGILTTAVFILLAAWGLPVQGQSLKDFRFDVKSFDGTCLHNMVITINHERVTTPSVGEVDYSFEYNLKRADGTFVYLDGEATAKNSFEGLYAGTYTPVVFMRVFGKDKDDNIIDVTSKQELDPVTVKTSYKQPSIDVALERKPLPGYKDESGSPVNNTGIIRVKMLEGNADCIVRIKEAPEGFRAEAERRIAKGGSFKYYGVLPGKYVFSIDDSNCGSLGDRTINVEYLDNPYPVGQWGGWPVGGSYQSPDMRKNRCGWFRNSLNRVESRYLAKNPDIIPYFSSMDTIVKYYQYALYSNYDESVGKPKVFYDFCLPDTPEHPYWDKKAGTFTTKVPTPDGKWPFYYYTLYGYIERSFVQADSVKWGPKEQWRESQQPKFYLRVKGQEEGSTNFKQLIPIGRGDLSTYPKFEGGNICLDEFQLGVTTLQDWWRNLACLPLKVELLDGGPGRQKLDELVIESSPEHDGGDDGKLVESDYIFFPKARLRVGRIYYIRVTDPKGYTHEQQYVYSTKIILENPNEPIQIASPCRGRLFMLRITNWMRPFSNYTITLKSAPKGYKPDEYPNPGNFKRLHVGESYKPKKWDDKRRGFEFLPFSMDCPRYSGRFPMGAYLPYTPDASGDYVFELRDSCGRVQTHTYTLPPLEPADFEYHPEYFQPKITRPECGRIRIYPFAGENSDRILTLNGKPFDALCLWINEQSFFPPGVHKGDIKTNVDIRWHAEDMITMQNKQNNGKNIPTKDVWLELPDLSGTLKMQALPYAVDWTVASEYPKCFGPLLEVNLDNLTLSYNHETYASYACVDHKGGSILIEPINNSSPVTMELYDERGGTLLEKRTGISSLTEFKLGNYIDKTGGSVKLSYFMRITDPKCSNYVEEVLPVYDLNSMHLISTIPDRKNICQGESLTLICPNFGRNMTYVWTLPDKTVMTGRRIKIPLDKMNPDLSGVFNILVTGETDCRADKTVYRHAFVVSISPLELWWNRPEDADWNNIRNWYNKEGKPANAVPAHCTDVHIPAHPGSLKDARKDIFPDLSPEVTVQGDFSVPECNDIYFHYGSKLGNPQELTYHRAYVDYNFGTVMAERPDEEVPYTEGNVHFPNADTVMMSRNRWYMLAAPLKMMYSADFGMAGYPMIYSRYVRAKQQGALTDAEFGAAYPNPASRFSSDEYDKSKSVNGMAIKVEGYRDLGKGGAEVSNQKNLNRLHGIIRIPYFEDRERLKAYELEQYNPETGKSRVWYFNRRTLKPLNAFEELIRNESAYRFVFETDLGDGKPGIGSIQVEGSPTKGYWASTEKVEPGEWFMAGNPFMAPIDFDKLCEANSHNIEPYFYIYRDGRWNVYSKDAKTASTIGGVIQPLQSVLLRKKGGIGMAFPTFGKYSVLVDPNRAEELQTLSRAIEAGKEYPLHITAGSHTGETVAMLSYGGEKVSIPALSNKEGRDIPLVYIVDPETGEGNSFESANEGDREFAVGVYTSLNAPIELRIDNIDRDRYKVLMLEDRLTGQVQNMLDNPVYRFVNEQGHSGRRFILRTAYGPAGAEAVGKEDAVRIVSKEQMLLIEASSDIAEAAVYDMAGRMAAIKRGETAPHIELRVPVPGEYIVKVKLVNGTGKIEKVMIR